MLLPYVTLLLPVTWAPHAAAAAVIRVALGLQLLLGHGFISEGILLQALLPLRLLPLLLHG